MIASRNIKFQTIDRVQDTDDFERATEAYADGLLTCFKCLVTARTEDFSSCPYGDCPMGEGEC